MPDEPEYPAKPPVNFPLDDPPPKTPPPPRKGPDRPVAPPPEPKSPPQPPPDPRWPTTGGHTREKVPPGKPGEKPPEDGIPPILEWKLDWVIWELDRIRKGLRGCLVVLIPVLLLIPLLLLCIWIVPINNIFVFPFLKPSTPTATSQAGFPTGVLPATAQCEDSSPGPSVRYGGPDLYPLFGSVPAGGSAAVTLSINNNTNPPSMSVGVPGGGQYDVFEICVHTNPPATHTHLGSHVTGKLTSPAGDQTWNMVFGTLFVNPLQDTDSGSAGIIKVDVSAAQLNAALQNAPTNTATEQIEFQLGSTFILNLTLVKQ